MVVRLWIQLPFVLVMDGFVGLVGRDVVLFGCLLCLVCLGDSFHCIWSIWLYILFGCTTLLLCLFFGCVVVVIIGELYCKLLVLCIYLC